LSQKQQHKNHELTCHCEKNKTMTVVTVRKSDLSDYSHSYFEWKFPYQYISKFALTVSLYNLKIETKKMRQPMSNWRGLQDNSTSMDSL